MEPATVTRHRHLTTAIAWTLAVIITVSGTSMAGSVVLCIGSNGHVDVEIALGPCCLTDVDGRDGDVETAQVDTCGRCADIELDATPLTREKHRLRPPVAIASWAPIDLHEILEPSCGFDHQAEGGSADLATLATVVLLT